LQVKVSGTEEVKHPMEKTNKLRSSLLVKRPNVVQSARNHAESSEDE
jgi:hypothetical protein